MSETERTDTPASQVAAARYTTVSVRLLDHALFVTLNRPRVRNAMSLAMVDELIGIFTALKGDRSIRAVVMRGAEGHFCAGGDIKDMAMARQAEAVDGVDPIARVNRRFGDLLVAAQGLDQVLVVALEGSVLGGGFGLACVSDVAIATADARFGLPEVTLGLPPAQIALFVGRRIGLAQTRRLALTGARFNGTEAGRLGLVHYVEADENDLEWRLKVVLAEIRRCAPEALAVTRAMLNDLAAGSDVRPLDRRLDEAADAFAQAVRGDEGMAGTLAFISKQRPPWNPPTEEQPEAEPSEGEPT
ncbi:MAG: enoyl-CoA hydratase/isomerase family protein [Bradymonadia bacterium]